MNEKNIIVELSQMSLGSFLKKYNSMTLEERNQLLNNPYLDELNPVIFSSFFLQVDTEQAEQILTYPKIFHKVLMSPKNNKRRNILNIVGEKNYPLLKSILESEYLPLYKNQFYEYIQSIGYDKFQFLLENVNLTKMYSVFFPEYSVRQLESLTGFHHLNSDISASFLQKVKLKQLNPLGILKAKNEKEFLLYTKFGLCVPVLDGADEITLEHGVVLPYQNILDVSEGKINKLIQLLKNKGQASTEELLEVGLKLYYTFGYDNARKIIMDKFTNMTPSAIIRIADFNFKDHRREYRTNHQECFYHYEMVDELLAALKYEEHQFFSNLLFNPSLDKILILEQDFLDIISSYTNTIELKDAIKDKVIHLINQREAFAKDVYTKEIKERLSILPSRTLSIIDLKNLVQDVSLLHFVKEYNPDTFLRLQHFLLGNEKADNDCILRLIINQEALGLNQMLGKLVNQFEVIESIAKKNNLSLNSVLDVIDIVKTSFFSLKPNEQDIFLSTIAKIISSKEYCSMGEEEILKETCKLHVERKKKVYASIPTIMGEKGDFQYQVAPFDAEYLLAAGVDAKNCFRISGKGEDFFRYCLTSNQAVVMYFTNSKHTYVCPIVRSGNGIHCNGVDPELPPEERDSFFEAFSAAMEDIITTSNECSISDQRIEVATVTDLHLESYFAEQEYPKYQLEVDIPLDQYCYTDYNKKEKTHYIIAQSATYQENKYYLAQDQFYQERSADYEFNVNREYDKERLSLIVNSIAYSSIDYKNISTSRKNKEKRKFKPIDVDTFQYIVGNKDWYVAIDNQFNILANLLPYDERAKRDYFRNLARAPLLLESMLTEENNHDGNRENVLKKTLNNKGI